MPQSLTIIIIDKNCTLKTLNIKDFKENELYKKCGFKQSEGFGLQTEWPIKFEGQKYIIAMYGKTIGKANMENKYDFPPPVDKTLYFGSCALIGMLKDDSNKRSFFNLSIQLWHKLYEKLFGGFEDLSVACLDDENEEDELDNIPNSKKTKVGGYLKDGFVVDNSDNDVDDDDDYTTDNSSNSSFDNKNNSDDNDEDDEYLENIGSELSEESYDYTN